MNKYEKRYRIINLELETIYELLNSGNQTL